MKTIASSVVEDLGRDLGRRDQDGDAAGRDDRPHVPLGHEHAAHVLPLSEVDGDVVGADPDHRPLAIHPGKQYMNGACR